MTPQFIFEVSWEVCNKVGGIYTVITSKAPVLQPDYHDRLLFIGPDVWKGSTEHPDFTEDRNLLRAWREQALADGLKIRVGRWNIPGNPMAILVDFTPYFSQKNDIFTKNRWWTKCRSGRVPIYRFFTFRQLWPFLWWIFNRTKLGINSGTLCKRWLCWWSVDWFIKPKRHSRCRKNESYKNYSSRKI